MEMSGSGKGYSIPFDICFVSILLRKDIGEVLLRYCTFIDSHWSSRIPNMNVSEKISFKYHHYHIIIIIIIIIIIYHYQLIDN